MEPEWLNRLDQATEYRQLHVIFSEISTDARGSSNDPELAGCIDQAIGRIQQESLRDECDLQRVEMDYESFKQQQRGFFGWLRRYFPFTETRRKEKRHIQAVADHRAEILANQLIMARAQMIKEHLLPPDSRRLGYTATQWQRRLTECDSLEKIQDYATIVRQLLDELQQSRAFVSQLEASLDAFGKARFSGREDQRRKDLDLSAARNELSGLQSEIETEQSLRLTAIGRLGELVSDELEKRDADYRRLRQRIALLETASRHALDAEQPFEALQSTCASMCKSAEELESIPGKVDQLIDQLRRIDRELQDADRQRIQAAADEAELKSRFHAANDKVQRARAGVEAAENVYNAYLAESGYAELPSNDSSPVSAEYMRQKEALKEAESELRVIAPPFQQATAKLQQSEQEADGLRQKQSQAQREQDALETRKHQLRSELESARHQLHQAIGRVDKTADDYLDSLRAIGNHDWVEEFEQLMPKRQWGLTGPGLVPASSDIRDLERSRDLIVRAVKHVRDVRNWLDHDHAAEQQKRKTMWTSRCTELLGDELSAEICQPS